MKLSKNKIGNKIRPKFDLQRLECDDIQRPYNVEVRNRFEVLQDKEDQNDYAEEMEKAYVQTANKILGFVKRKIKPWLGDNTWQKIEARKAVKQKIESTKSEGVKERLRKEYRTKDREVKRSAREDRRKWIEDLAGKAEIAAEKGRTRVLYNITKAITNKGRQRMAAVKNKQEETIKEKNARMERWKEHFSEVLTRETPDNSRLVPRLVLPDLYPAPQALSSFGAATVTCDGSVINGNINGNINCNAWLPGGNASFSQNCTQFPSPSESNVLHNGNSMKHDSGRIRVASVMHRNTLLPSKNTGFHENSTQFPSPVESEALYNDASVMR